MDVRKQRRSQNFLDRGYAYLSGTAYADNGNALPLDDYLEYERRNRTLNMPPPYRAGYDLTLSDIARRNQFQEELWRTAPFVEQLPDGFAPRDMSRRDPIPPGGGPGAIPRPQLRRGLQRALQR